MALEPNLKTMIFIKNFNSDCKPSVCCFKEVYFLEFIKKTLNYNIVQRHDVAILKEHLLQKGSNLINFMQKYVYDMVDIFEFEAYEHVQKYLYMIDTILIVIDKIFNFIERERKNIKKFNTDWKNKNQNKLGKTKEKIAAKIAGLTNKENYKKMLGKTKEKIAAKIAGLTNNDTDQDTFEGLINNEVVEGILQEMHEGNHLHSFFLFNNLNKEKILQSNSIEELIKTQEYKDAVSSNLETKIDIQATLNCILCPLETLKKPFNLVDRHLAELVFKMLKYLSEVCDVSFVIKIEEKGTHSVEIAIIDVVTGNEIGNETGNETEY